ncbi:SDR family oxidoreductase [Qipengyuania qiaonensis]|uniref:SDR family oxidoreductase n=1 Tax=Qipengyuania qiaonensis TaxID=2867240 RepID=A0ABS7J5S1_9SPHN|nr:SDR family oxidoreductase [Qipengyuania qiaonensis]MBX7481606.1 SDR family oxidoreductase [Qipengyuania qiaonensis]
MAMLTLADQRVCIVGGTAGMGLALARICAEQGADVVIGGRDGTKAARIAEETGPNVTGVAIDVLDAASVAACFAELGPVDHLVVTAAVVRPGPFRGLDDGDARATFDGKFWASYNCARLADVRTSILFFSGNLSSKPATGMVAVGAANAALEGLARGLAVELAPLRVNVISPGLISGTDAYAGMSGADREAMYAAKAAQLPTGRVGSPEDVGAMAFSFMVSKQATGSLVVVDGGAVIT